VINPFQPPRSELTLTDGFRRSIAWKIYFFCITALSALGMLGLLLTPGAGLSELAQLALWLVASTGLFGFAFDRPIATPGFWLCILLTQLTCSVGYYFITDIDYHAGLTSTQLYLRLAIGWLLCAPTYYALYRLGRASDPVWRPRRGTADEQGESA